MTAYILTLLAAVISSSGFLSYKHPDKGAKIASFGAFTCIAIFIAIETYYWGYSYAMTNYFQLDKNQGNLDAVKNIVSDNILSALIINGITGVSFFVIYILSLTTFKDIVNENIKNSSK